MKLKTVEINGKTYAEVLDGKPVFTGEDGKDVGYDVPSTIKTIASLNYESKTKRERISELEATLKPFDGITNPLAAIKALETVKNFDDKKLIDAGEVEKLKAEMTKVYEQKILAANEIASKATLALNSEIVGGAFARSKYASDNLTLPSDIVEKQFSSHFSVEEGKLVAKDSVGNQIYSKSSAGTPAKFDEALEIIVDGYSHKDAILKSAGGSGSGASGNNGNNGAKTMSRTQFDALDTGAKASSMKDGVTLTD